MVKGFWAGLARPIIGLSPMDGVTDAAFRLVAARHGKPDLTFTEFTSVEGIRAGALRLLDDFRYSPEERPVVAQLFGADPEAFYQAALVVCALGFDGIDINMGCPAKNVTSHGAGAALIRDPERALLILQRTRQAAQDWAEGRQLMEAGVSDAIIEATERLQPEAPRRELPVSVKTRIGYQESEVERWIGQLAEAAPVAITLHGRTLRQLYSGQADWEAIARAAAIAHQHGILILGNGDISSRQDALRRIAEAGVDGVLIGRAAQGNPWLFQDREASLEERLAVALEHARLFADLFPPVAFVRMRKHLLDYTKGFEGARELRGQLMRCSSLAEAEQVLLPALAAC